MIDIITPTWNSMPEFKEMLESLNKAFPTGSINKLIVVDKGSNDGTQKTAKNYGARVIIDDGTLGHARWTGIKNANADWIAFIDSDIRLPADWYEMMTSYIDEKIGWVYGQTIDDRIRYVAEKKLKKMNGQRRILKYQERAYTNNSLVRRRPLIEYLDVEKLCSLSAWEDAVLTKAVQDAGYDVAQVPVSCDHLRVYTERKFGNYRPGWSMAGQISLYGRKVRMLTDSIWMITLGFEIACIQGEPKYALYGIRNFLIAFMAWIFPDKYWEVKR